MRLSETCPKCAGLAWYEIELDPEGGREIHLRCHCGYRQAVYSESRGQLSVPKKVIGARSLRRGTKRAECLGELGRAHPREVSTSEIAHAMDVSPATAATYLIVLRVKGLVTVSEQRKGQKGGSYWRLTVQGLRELGIKEA